MGTIRLMGRAFVAMRPDIRLRAVGGGLKPIGAGTLLCC